MNILIALCGVALIIVISAILSIPFSQLKNKKSNRIRRNIYISRLENSNNSIREAVKYLTLTNSLASYCKKDK